MRWALSNRLAKRAMRLFATLIFSISGLSIPCGAQSPPDYDIVIYGGTSAAITSAVQAKRMGKTVVIVCPDTHLGGLTSGGLGWTDSGDKTAIGGLSRDFYHQVWKHYQSPQAWRQQKQSDFGNRSQSPGRTSADEATMWVFEPHVAEHIFEAWVSHYDIPVHRDQWLDRSPGGVTMDHNRIISFRTENGERYVGRMFIDATYEGDLMAAAGVSYHVGREANATYGEKFNGIQVGVLHHGHHFKNQIDPYVTPGDPESGLLPLISADPPGEFGEADKRIQAYCFRMCLTDADDNRIPFTKPAGYDASQYELLSRVLQKGRREVFNKFDPLPNRKTDTNNHGPVSTDYIGMSDDYPEASYDRRREIVSMHEKYQKGLMYFLANDPRVPDDVRVPMSRWGLPKDEFVENGGWSHQLYIREARRMIGQYVMTEQDCLDQRITPSPIGMGSYTLDSHNVQRYVKPDGYVQNEGDIGVPTPRPYEIAYGAIVPQKSDCENLLVPVCVSSSHIAFGSIRMEPVFMILGQSAATAASLSIDRALAVQDLDYETLRARLVDDGQVLQWDSHYKLDARNLPGVVVDDASAAYTGEWTLSNANAPYIDAGYRHNGNEKKNRKSAIFEAELSPGRYQVRLSYSVNSNRATNIPITIVHRDGSRTVKIDETQTPQIENLFVDLGTYDFDNTGAVRIDTVDTDGFVVVDAVQWIESSE